MLGIGEGLCSYVVNNKLVCFDIGCPNMRYSFKEPIDSFYSHFSNGLLAVRVCGNGAGFVDSKCNIIIPLIYRNVKDFTCGLAAVQSQDTLKWGYINIKGELVIDFKYDDDDKKIKTKRIEKINSDFFIWSLDEEETDPRRMWALDKNDEEHGFWVKADSRNVTVNSVVPLTFKQLQLRFYTMEEGDGFFIKRVELKRVKIKTKTVG